MITAGRPVWHWLHTSSCGCAFSTAVPESGRHIVICDHTIAGASGIQTILQNVDGLEAALAAPATAPAAAPTAATVRPTATLLATCSQTPAGHGSSRLFLCIAHVNLQTR